MSAPASAPRGAILVDRDLRAALGSWIAPCAGAPAIAPDQVQPASLDLRLGPQAVRIRAGFLPGRAPLPERIRELEVGRQELDGDGAVLERGLVYLVRLEERLDLAPEVRASFNPRSSAGRCDVFTRVLVPGHPRFNEAPPGYSGELWMEVSPLSFSMRFRRGDRLGQVRLARGDTALTARELEAVQSRTPLLWRDGKPLARDQARFDGRGGVELTLGLRGRDPAGWRARKSAGVLCFGDERAHDAAEFFEPVRAPRGQCLLAPGSFHVFASREEVVIPPELAAEMIPVDVGIGEMRNNYAGFFDSGFGWREGAGMGTAAVLEVRAHDVPFLVDEGQVLCRLRYHRTAGRPDALYGEGRAERSYRDQDLTLARAFRAGESAPRTDPGGG